MGPYEAEEAPEAAYGPSEAPGAAEAPAEPEGAAEALAGREGAEEALAGREGAEEVSSESDGLVVASPERDGLAVVSSEPDGLVVAPPERDGLAEVSPESDGLAVASPERDGALKPVAEFPKAQGAPAAPSEPPAPGDGRFTVRLANFEGPFDLLLQLISKHRLDVTEVALSRVTDEFMAHIRAMGPDWDLDQTTEFLVVAATLLDLKAARLLPVAEVEDEGDLALLEARDLLFARLLQYRAYKRIAEIFADRWESEGRRYPRTVGLEPHHAELLPEVVISIGAEGFAALAVKAMQPKARPQVYVDHIHAPLVSVREQAGIVVALLRERGVLSFRELAEGAEDTLTVVARFLALLELYREKAVALDQETALGDLTVSWTGGASDLSGAVTDEFDQADQADRAEQADRADQEAAP
ncbi:ScpA family protein [Streptomyces sp. NPDC094032]|uniref:segregation and condensation protein A n=1 Tax=Streptomyces sp. NPDC094032 TaxID=3155308 RepID=UPI003331E65D